jgi:hypothetical protein
MTGSQPTMTRLPAKELSLQPEESRLRAKEIFLQAKGNVLPPYPGGGNWMIFRQLRVFAPAWPAFLCQGPMVRWDGSDKQAR